MAFKEEIITAIQTAADSKGDTETVATLGTNGTGWNRASGKYSRMEVLAEAWGAVIPERMVSRGKPYDGILTKKITSFILPHTVVLQEAHGVVIGDTFVVAGSVNNDGEYSVTGIIGNQLAVAETVDSELCSPALGINIDPPLTNVNIERTLQKVQADISSKLPKTATTTDNGLVKQIPAIEKFDELTTNRAEQTFNLLVDALRNSGAMAVV